MRRLEAGAMRSIEESYFHSDFPYDRPRSGDSRGCDDALVPQLSAHVALVALVQAGCAYRKSRC